MTIRREATAPAGRALTHLGSVAVADFMRDSWQRRPWLLRQAFDKFVTPVTRDELFALAARPEVESRLVSLIGGRWRLAHGPFDPRSLPSPARAGWTLLVQGVDLYVPAAHTLLERFRFLPDARLDDVMISWASDGGGVGPHVDSYDVFLLQAKGRRRWRISRQHDRQLVAGLPLQILADFRPEQSWVLETGDLLYLPPGVAHEGIALGHDCITCSIGFRAPAYDELVNPWLDSLATRARQGSRYRDPGLVPTSKPARLPPSMIARAHAQLVRIRPQPADAARALLQRLSEPKPNVSFEAPARKAGTATFSRLISRRGLRTDPRTRMLYAAGDSAINGELYTASDLDRTTRTAFCRMADRRRLSAAECSALSPATTERFRQWYLFGWLKLG